VQIYNKYFVYTNILLFAKQKKYKLLIIKVKEMIKNEKKNEKNSKYWVESDLFLQKTTKKLYGNKVK
jgi:hypothetical protein